MTSLFWEIRTRVFYILLSLGLAFLMSYFSCNGLLYLFVLAYGSTKPPQHTLSEPFALNVTIFDLQSDFSKTCSLDWLSTPPSQVGAKNRCGEGLAAEIVDINSYDLGKMNFIFTDVEEAFSNVVGLCLAFSFVSILPILIYQSFSFLSSSLHAAESRKFIFRLFCLVLLSTCFAYTVQNLIIPKAVEFLLFFEISSSAFSLSAETRISSYCSWVSSIWLASCLLFFGLLFFSVRLFSKIETMLSCYGKQYAKNDVMRFQPTRYAQLAKRECSLQADKKTVSWICQRKKHAIVSLLFSAIIAPPESFQIVLSLLLFCCFEIMIFFSSIILHWSLKTKI